MIEEIVSLSEEEYLNYLEKLKTHKEKYIIQKVIAANLAVYPVTNFIYEQQKKQKNSWFGSAKRTENMGSFGSFGMTENDSVKNSIFDLNKVTIEEYLSRTDLDNIYTERYANNRKEVKIITYKLIKTLGSGETFGEKALDSDTKKR